MILWMIHIIVDNDSDEDSTSSGTSVYVETIGVGEI